MFTKMKYIVQKDIQGIIEDKAFITHWCTFSGTPSSYWLPNTVTGGCNDRVRTCACVELSCTLSADRSCTRWLFELMLPSMVPNQSAHSNLWPLTSTWHFRPHNCYSLDIYSYENLSRAALWKLNNVAVQNQLNPFSSQFWCSHRMFSSTTSSYPTWVTPMWLAN